MCNWVKNGYKRIDPCMRPLIAHLNNQGITTKACCCGHGKYRSTVIIEENGKLVELYTRMEIPRIKRFYRRDSRGVFYVPEIQTIK